MTAPLFLIAADRLVGSPARLDGPEGRHAATVRRLTRGERVDLTDGAGALLTGRVAAVGPDWLDVEILDRRSVAPAQPRLVVVQALAKADRGELAVEAMTEVGVDEIVPWAADRSVVRWSGARGERALRRWRATGREAAKQARRPWLPVVGELASTDDVIARLSTAALAVVLDEGARTPLAGIDLPTAGDIVLVVGPEGGITGAELDAFTGAGAGVARLGPTVLRTSTAGVAAGAVVLGRAGRWG